MPHAASRDDARKGPMISSLRSARLVALLLLLSLTLVAAACGSGASTDAAAGGGTDSAAADAVPADVLFFATGNIDTGSEAWTRLQALGQRFPGWTDAVAKIDRALARSSNGMSFDEDVKPWLGGEAALAVTSVQIGAAGPKPVIVGYVASRDEARLRAAVEGAEGVTAAGEYEGHRLYSAKDDDGEPVFLAVGEGALLVATTESARRSALDVRAGKGESLASSDAYEATVEKLADDAVLTAFVDGPKLAQVAQLAGRQAGGAALAPLTEQLGALRSLGFSVAAEENGLRVRGVALAKDGELERLALGEPFDPTLDERVPGNALAYAGFRDLGPQLARVVDGVAASTPAFGQQLGQFEALAGVSFRNDIVPLLSGEHALYVAPGEPVSAALLLRPADAAAGAATFRKLTAAASRLGAGVAFTPLPGGGEGQQVAVGDQTLLWRRAGEVLALGNDPKAGDAREGALAGSEAYRDLLEQAGAGDEVLGVLYVDTPGIVALARQAGKLDDAEARANLEHIGGIAAFSAVDGDTVTTDLFVGVR